MEDTDFGYILMGEGILWDGTEGRNFVRKELWGKELWGKELWGGEGIVSVFGPH